VLGYELDEDQEAELELLIAAKDELARLQAQQAQAQRDAQANVIDGKVVPPRQLMPGETAEQKAAKDDLLRWQRKVENRLRAGKSAQVGFASEYIDEDTNARVEGLLSGATDMVMVKSIFDFAATGAWKTGAQPSDTGTPFRTEDYRVRLAELQAIPDATR